MLVQVEPAVYLPMPAPQTSPTEELKRFERDLGRLWELLSSNGAKFPMTVEFAEAFDEQLSALYGMQLGGPLNVAAALARRLFAQRSVRVDLDRLDGPEVLSDLLSRATPVYLLEDLWIAWTSLLVQHTADLPAEKESPVLSPSRGCTCLPASDSRRFRGYPLGGPPPPGLVDPEALARLRVRCEGTRPDFRYEDSGHLPHAGFKRVLERTAERTGVAVRMGTTRHKPDCSDACRIRAGGEWNEIDAEVCDGHEKFGATFHTTASDAGEQATALIVLAREFYYQCRQERYRVATES